MDFITSRYGSARKTSSPLSEPFCGRSICEARKPVVYVVCGLVHMGHPIFMTAA